MTEREEILLAALASMASQYLEEDGTLDHMFISAGEQAMQLLFEHGLIDTAGRCASWTAQGRAFLASH